MKTRHILDAYYTNQKLVEQLLLKYPISKDKVILEPCSGKGHISNYLKVLGYEVITNDIDIDVEANTHHDMTADISHLQLTDTKGSDSVTVAWFIWNTKFS